MSKETNPQYRINSADPAIAAADAAMSNIIALSDFTKDMSAAFKEIYAREQARSAQATQRAAERSSNVPSLGVAGGFTIGLVNLQVGAMEASQERKAEIDAGSFVGFDQAAEAALDKLASSRGSALGFAVAQFDEAAYDQLGEQEYARLCSELGCTPGQARIQEITSSLAVYAAAQSQVSDNAAAYAAERIMRGTMLFSGYNSYEKENMGEIYNASKDLVPSVGDKAHGFNSFLLTASSVAIDAIIEWPLWTFGQGAVSAGIRSARAVSATAAATRGTKIAAGAAVSSAAVGLVGCSSSSEAEQKSPTTAQRREAAAKQIEQMLLPTEGERPWASCVVGPLVEAIAPGATPAGSKFPAASAEDEATCARRLAQELAALQQAPPDAKTIRVGNAEHSRQWLAARVLERARVLDRLRFKDHLTIEVANLPAADATQRMAQLAADEWPQGNNKIIDPRAADEASLRREAIECMATYATMSADEKLEYKGQMLSRAEMLSQAAANIGQAQTLEQKRISEDRAYEESIKNLPENQRQMASTRHRCESLLSAYPPSEAELEDFEERPSWMASATTAQLEAYALACAKMHSEIKEMGASGGTVAMPSGQTEDLTKNQMLLRARAAAAEAQQRYSQEQAYAAQQELGSPAAVGEDGWGNTLLSLIDGEGFFDQLLRNPGPTLAMLPDMIAGGLAGDNGLLGSEHAVPMMLLLGSMLIPDKSTKSMMMVAGAGLMANASRKEQGKMESAEERSRYKTYPDEALDPRISSIQLNGTRLAMDIDGRPVVLDISQDAAQACACGAVPPNVLANRMLAAIDRQQQEAARAYADAAQRNQGPSIMLR